MTDLRDDARAIALQAIGAADARLAVERSLRLEGDTLRAGGATCDLRDRTRIILAGAGKASARMALAVEHVLGDRIDGGLIVVRDDPTSHAPGVRDDPTSHAPAVRDDPTSRRPMVRDDPTIQPPGRPSGPVDEPLLRTPMITAGHPLPDERSLHAGEQMLTLLEPCTASDLVIFCLGGGASALLEVLPAGVSLQDLRQLTGLLLACGAPIEEFNTVRRALSRIKGGGLLRAAFPARCLVLVMSDVLGNPLDKIGSGPFIPGTDRVAARNVLERYELQGRLPPSITRFLADDRMDPLPSVPPCQADHVVIADNRVLAGAAATAAGARGYHTLTLTTWLEGEAREVARVLAAVARQARSGLLVPLPACIVASGETTVTVRGQGSGGRNQEMALAFALAAGDLHDFAFASVASDGSDGPTTACGAIVDSQAIALASPSTARASLENNDSWTFFNRFGGLVETGPTGTNVNDLQVLLVK